MIAWTKLLIAALLIELSHGQGCKQDGPLGMISGEIRDWQITASSTFPAKWSRGCEERHARVYGKDGLSWCAQYKGASEWLQIDLGVRATLTGVMTQGRGDGRAWVTDFALSYSDDAAAWTDALDEGGKRKEFEANTDSYSVKHNYLDQPIVARFVRLHPLRYHRHPSMRVELIGCQSCKQLLSLPPYARLTASTSRGRRAMRNCDASYGHSMTGKAWCARKQDAHQWLQVDLGPPAKVTGLVTKGRGDGRSNAWVTAYRVAYGSDGKLWTLYKDADHLSPKVFGGNHNRDSERIHYLNRPFTARFVRFHPVTWQGRIAMRVGVIGCPRTDSGSSSSCIGGAFFRFNNSSRCLANLAYGKAAWISSSDGGGVGRHSKRQAAGAAGGVTWSRWSADGVHSGAGIGGCVAVGAAAESGSTGWLVDVGSKQPIQGILLAANASNAGWLDSVQVFVAKRSRQLISAVGAGGSGGGPRRLQKGRFKCGSVQSNRLGNHGPEGGYGQQHRSVHISCSKTMLGRFVYIEAHAAAAAMATVGGGRDRTSGSSLALLCDLRVY